ncbi:ADP-dependent glucokinase/phosphofructokinase [Bauldia sp.]|uniref:ADP-dependent glucokinase/phosphofructokinase n=1 Tax=Bauldia sp. TaxID=2575872 RepID=UPI003BAC9D59
MTTARAWSEAYTALIARLPELAKRSRLTIGGFSTCVDVYLSFHETVGPLSAAANQNPDAVALLAELERRALNGIGGELFVNWPGGPRWIDDHVTGRRAIGGTNAQAAYMLAELGARSLIALEDRTAGQLTVLHPDTLVASDDGLVPISSLSPAGRERSPHYVFEFTAGETIGERRVPRSSRTIVRFDHDPLQHDAAFVRASVQAAAHAGAGVLCGFNEIAPEDAAAEFDYAADTASAWRRAGLEIVHVELGDFHGPEQRDQTLERLMPVATSLGMSLSELTDLTQAGTSPDVAAQHLAEAHALERICIHADDWAFTVTRGDPEREREALMIGCLLAAARAAAGYFAVPDRLPDGARFRTPPLPPSRQRDGWSIVCCPAPYLEKPAATIGLGDTFLAGTLLVLGGSSNDASAQDRPRAASAPSP